MAFVRHTIDINGCKLSFARAGEGVPLLYLHGTDGLANGPPFSIRWRNASM
jgi:hypothetical protein